MLTFEQDGLTKEQLLEQYNVVGFSHNLCIVERMSDGVIGSFDFCDVAGTRYYYDFREHGGPTNPGSQTVRARWTPANS